MNLFDPRQLKQMDGLFEHQKDYPFPFLTAYAEYLHQSGQGKWMLCLTDTREIAMPVRIYSSGFLRILQILHVPLQNGKLLDKKEEALFLEGFIKTASGGNW
ncbi:MAG TPA: hypothetical protein VNZ86_20210, partial [Bacteroidia bacterium]|nr:hypothetical protein [Bacteroidia bacterium]